MLDFEKNPGQYRDLDDFLDIIDFYLGTDNPMLFSQDSRLAQAVRMAENIYPDNTDIKVQRAHIYFMQGNTDSAKNILSYLEKVEPEHIGVLLGLADCHFQNNRFDKGMAYLKKVLTIDPENIDVYDTIIQQNLVQCKVEDALQYFKKRIALKSDDDEAFLSRVYGDLEPIPQVYESALKFFEAYIDQNPYSSYAWTYIAMAHYELHHDEEAIEACEYALAINTGCTGAYLTKYEVTNDVRGLYEALAHVPENEMYHINMQIAEHHFRAHKYAVAAPYYRTVIKYIDDTGCDDDFTGYIARHKLANCYMRMNDPVSAEKLLLESIILNPYSTLAYDDLAILYKYDFHDPDRFEQMFSFLTQKFSDCKYPWVLFLGFLLQQRRYDDVVKKVGEAEEYIHDDDELYIPLSVAYYHTNRKNEAYLLLNNMDIDPNYLEDTLRKYDGEMLLDTDVMEILLKKYNESDTSDYYDDGYGPNDNRPGSF